MKRCNNLWAGILFLVVAGWSCSASADLSAYSYLETYVYPSDPESLLTTGEYRQTYTYLYDGATYEDAHSGSGDTDSYVEGPSGGYAAGYQYDGGPSVETYAVSPDGSATQATAWNLGEWSFEVLGTDAGQGRLLAAFVDYYFGFEMLTENPGDWANGWARLTAVLTNTTPGGSGASVSDSIDFSLSAFDGEESSWDDDYTSYGGPLELSLFFGAGDTGTFRVEVSGLAEAGSHAVPVPGAFLLGSLGLGFAGWFQRRQMR